MPLGEWSPVSQKRLLNSDSLRGGGGGGGGGGGVGEIIGSFLITKVEQHTLGDNA